MGEEIEDTERADGGVEVHEPEVRMRMWAAHPVERDAIEIRVVRYTDTGWGWRSEYLDPRGEWVEYRANDLIPVTIDIPSTEFRHVGGIVKWDEVGSLAEDLTRRITELWNQAVSDG